MTPFQRQMINTVIRTNHEYEKCVKCNGKKNKKYISNLGQVSLKHHEVRLILTDTKFNTFCILMYLLGNNVLITVT